MEKEIIRKLREFLDRHTPMTEECHIVYLLVEIRKLIERIRCEAKYPILQFYCNWTLHTCKSRDNQAILEIMERIEKSIANGAKFQETKILLPADESPLQFISLEKLKEDMEKFFNDMGLSDFILQGSNWSSFRDLLTHVLADQPIKNLPGNIDSIYFQPARKGAAILIIKFKDGTPYKIANYFGEE